MADNYFQMTIEPSLPEAKLTNLELWLLQHLFDWEGDDGDTLYFFAENGTKADSEDDEEALDAILAVDTSPLAEKVREVRGEEPADYWLDGFNFDDIFQGILRRNLDIPHVKIQGAFHCSKMRPGEFGGFATFITKDKIESIDTLQWLNSRV